MDQKIFSAGSSFAIARLVLLMILLCTANSNATLKIYVMTDLEGITGVYKFAQTREKGELYDQACEFFMDDVAAVIKGLRDGGATEIVVRDGHGSGALAPHKMMSGAKYIVGRPRPNTGFIPEFDSSYDAMVMIGFHAMMGTVDGVLNHTMSSRKENRYWYNGVESGELAQVALIAGYYEVPMVMVSGDEATCREARTFFGNEIVTVATKKGLAREAAVLFPFEENHKALYEGAKQAISIIPKIKPYKIKTPIQVKEQSLKDPNMPKLGVTTREGVAQDALHLFSWSQKNKAVEQTVEQTVDKTAEQPN